MGVGSFVMIVPTKSLQPCQTDGQAGMVRATHDLELQQQFAGVDWGGKTFDMHFLPGGGLAVDAANMGQSTSVAVKDTSMAVFNGTLSNYSYLIKKYCMEKQSVDSREGGNAVSLLKDDMEFGRLAEACSLTEAEIVLMVYQQLGTTMLPKLRGEFAFCVFDSKTVRVLAARDPHGGIQLAQARAADGSLVIASGHFLPEGCTRLEEVPPGYFKYGWSAPIQRYAHNAEETREVAVTAAAAAARALEGSPAVLLRAASASVSSGLARTAAHSVPDSESGSESGSSRLRTRRGKRAGRHQQRRASLEACRTSLEVSRAHIDQSPLRQSMVTEVHSRPSRLSLDSQQVGPRAADRALWWRHPAAPESPEWLRRRQSVDCGSMSRATSVAAKLSPLAPIFEPVSAGGADSAALPTGSRACWQTNRHPTASSDTSNSCQTQELLSAADASKAAAAAFAVPLELRTRPGAAEPLEGRTSPSGHNGPATSFDSEHASCADSASGSTHVAEHVAEHVAAHRYPQLRGASSVAAEQDMQALPAGLCEALAGYYSDDGASVHMVATLLRSSPYSLCITDARQPDCPIVHVNSSFESATGYSSSEVVGRNCRFLQAPPGQPVTRSPAAAAIRCALDSGHAKGVRLLNYRKDGTPVHNDLTIVPLRNADCIITHFVGMQIFSAPSGTRQSLPPALVNGSLRAVQLGGGLTGLLEKSRSCLDFASRVDVMEASATYSLMT